MKFQYFTYFLNPLQQEDLFKDNRDKNDIFRDVITTGNIIYENRGINLAFVLESENNGYIVSKLGKRASIKRNSPPDRKFEETKEETWPNCLVVINTNPDNGTGQKIAFEFKSSVFREPFKQLSNFADELNRRHLFPSGYAVTINPVTEEKEFWELVKQHRDDLEKLTFTFNSPNLFGIENSLREDLKNTEEIYASTKVSLELENPDGKLRVPKNDLTNQSVEYITKGGGQYSLKLKSKKLLLRSEDCIKTKVFENLDINTVADNPQTLFE